MDAESRDARMTVPPATKRKTPLSPTPAGMETTKCPTRTSKITRGFGLSRKGHPQANLAENLLFAMKHFPSFYVFMGEGEIS
jgi:hypothetical protein